jgi:hypothetical protein
MADSALIAAGGDDAPLSYLVPGATAIRIKQIHVAYVDNSASGDWLPAVRIISDSKHTMGLAADQGVKVTAGSDASVSFFPGVKHAAAAGATVGSWLHVVAGTSTPSGTISLQNGTHMPIADFNTNDPVRFSQVSATDWNVTRGAYLITGQLRETTGVPVVANGDFTVGVVTASGFALYCFGGNTSEILTVALAGITIGDQSSFTSWRMVATGADTHAWVGECNFGYIQGT